MIESMRRVFHRARSLTAPGGVADPALPRIARFVLVVLALLVSAASARAADDRQKPLGDVPVMHEEAEAAGIKSVYDGPWEFFVGGGGAAFDCDGSGFPSVFLAGGKNPARLYVNRSRSGGPIKFEEKPLDIGADPKLLENVIGAYPIDISGDGHMDLFVLRVGGNLLLKGGPDCTFTLANHEWNFDGDPGWTTAFAAEWEPGQKFPTLAIGHYVDRSAPGSPWGTCEENSLYRPQGGDKPDYSVRTALAPGFCALSMLFTDWNKSGAPSLRVSNDRQYYRGGEEQMWRIEAGKTPRLYTRADGWRHLSIYGMGIAEGDLDGSGYPEYFLTSMGDEKLQKLDPDGGDRGRRPFIATSPARSGRRRIFPIPAATSGLRPLGTPNSPTSTTRGSSTSSSPRGISSRCRTSPPTIQAISCSASSTANSPRPATKRESPTGSRAVGRWSPTSTSMGGSNSCRSTAARTSRSTAISGPRMATSRRCLWATGARSS